MNLRNIFVPLAAVGALVFGFVSYGWPGVAAVGGGLALLKTGDRVRIDLAKRRASSNFPLASRIDARQLELMEEKRAIDKMLR